MNTKNNASIIYCRHVLRCAERTTSGSACELSNFRSARSGASVALAECEINHGMMCGDDQPRGTEARRHTVEQSTDLKLLAQILASFPPFYTASESHTHIVIVCHVDRFCVVGRRPIPEGSNDGKLVLMQFWWADVVWNQPQTRFQSCMKSSTSEGLI